jgi:hypothetical protein
MLGAAHTKAKMVVRAEVSGSPPCGFSLSYLRGRTDGVIGRGRPLKADER